MSEFDAENHPSNHPIFNSRFLLHLGLQGQRIMWNIIWPSTKIYMCSSGWYSPLDIETGCLVGADEKHGLNLGKVCFVVSISSLFKIAPTFDKVRKTWGSVQIDLSMLACLFYHNTSISRLHREIMERRKVCWCGVVVNSLLWGNTSCCFYFSPNEPTIVWTFQTKSL